MDISILLHNEQSMNNSSANNSMALAVIFRNIYPIYQIILEIEHRGGAVPPPDRAYGNVTFMDEIATEVPFLTRFNWEYIIDTIILSLM